MAPGAVKGVQEYVKEVQEFVKEVQEHQEHVREAQEFETIPPGPPENAPIAANRIQDAVLRHWSPSRTVYAGGVTAKAMCRGTAPPRSRSPSKPSPTATAGRR